jgi:hypothetical protein
MYSESGMSASEAFEPLGASDDISWLLSGPEMDAGFALVGNIVATSGDELWAMAGEVFYEREPEVYDYVASGGPSRIVRFPDGQELQMEVHATSFAVVWSTELDPDATLRLAAPLLPQHVRRARVVDAGQLRQETEISTVVQRIKTGGRGIALFRVQYDDRALSWENARHFASDARRGLGYARIGFVAESFDVDYIAELIERTGSARLNAAARKLLERAAEGTELVRQAPDGGVTFPAGALRLEDARGGWSTADV